jgi:hypothetical protein
VHAQLILAFVVEALDRGVLDGAVHPLDRAVGPVLVNLKGGLPVIAVAATLDLDRTVQQCVRACFQCHHSAVPPASLHSTELCWCCQPKIGG